MKIRIGTRGSLLALTQTNLVAQQLKTEQPGCEIEIIQVQTLGDKKQGTPQAGVSDKKEWVYELELALLNNKIDVAVHSAKDVPGNIEAGTEILPILERENPYDIFIGKKLADGTRFKFADLKDNSIVGTASLRRKASIFFHNPKIKLVDHRGNVPTRIKKLDESLDLSGIVIAKAGVSRLDILPEHEYEIIDPNIMLPAMNQGILCVQIRSEKSSLKDILSKLSDANLKKIFFAERFVAEKLEGDCQSAVSILATINNESFEIHARVMNPRMNKEVYLTKTVDDINSDFKDELNKFTSDLISLGAKELIKH